MTSNITEDTPPTSATKFSDSPPDPGCAFCVHEHMLTRNGIVHQENANFDDLIKDKVYRFMYVYTPMPIVGATGSAGSPLAID